jgi:hypothetical protein
MPSPSELNALLSTLFSRNTGTPVCAGVLAAEDEQPSVDLVMDSPYEHRAGAAMRLHTFLVNSLPS